MAIMAMDTVKKTKLTLAISIALLSGTSSAGEWTFTPAFILDETYTSNVELNRVNEIESIVSQTGLTFDTQYSSKQLDFNLKSRSVYAFYSHDHDLDSDYHELDSDFALKLGERGLSLLGSASIKNQTRNSARNALADIVSADTVQIANYNAGIGYNIENGDFVIDSSLLFSEQDSEDDIGNQKGYTADVALRNGTSARHIFWDGFGEYQERENDNQDSLFYRGDFKLGFITAWNINPFVRYYDEDNKGSLSTGGSSLAMNSYGAGIRWFLSERLAIDLSYNKPIGNDVDLEGKPLEEYVDAAINWQPTLRTKLQANYSQRFFGDSYGLNFTHRNRRLTNTISYQEEVQSFTRQNYNVIEEGAFWCPNSEELDLTNCYLQDNQNINLDDYQLIRLTSLELVEDDVLSLNKNVNWQSELTLPRTTFTVQIAGNERENLETRVVDESVRLAFNATRTLSPRSDLSFDASFNENLYGKETDNERHDIYRKVSLGYARKLNNELSIDIQVQHLNRSSDQEDFNYKEERVVFKITKDF